MTCIFIRQTKQRFALYINHCLEVQNDSFYTSFHSSWRNFSATGFTVPGDLTVGLRGHLTLPRNPLCVKLWCSQIDRLWGELWPAAPRTSAGSTTQLHRSSVFAREQHDRGRLISPLWLGRTVKTLRPGPTWLVPGYRCSLSRWLLFAVESLTRLDWRALILVNLALKTVNE